MTAQPDLSAAAPDTDAGTVNLSQKRKLSEVDSNTKPNGTTHEPVATIEQEPRISTAHSRQLMQDVFSILESHDIEPSVLQYSTNDVQVSAEPAIKRAKLSGEPDSTTIAGRWKANDYLSLHDLRDDIDRVSRSIVEEVQRKAIEDKADARKGPGALLPDEAKLISRTLAFQKFSCRLLDAHLQGDDAASRGKGTSINGVKTENADESVLHAGRSVLSIFANAQGSKQLFSSLQKEEHVRVTCGAPDDLSADVAISMPIAEAMLPTFLTLSRTGNMEPTKDQNRTRRTIGEVFTPSANRQLPDLQIPKPTNKLLTKSSSVNWISYEAASKSSATRPLYNWTTTKQVTGQWLSYGSQVSTQDSVSDEAKKRQRERALSTGASAPNPVDEPVVVDQEAREAALFRVAFSSFAPSVDNLGATVTHFGKNDIWWDKIGRQRAAEVFIDPALLLEDAEDLDIIDDKELEQVVETFDSSLLPSLPEDGSDRADDVDSKLEEITALIDTLYSYQKIRNSQLPSTAVPIVGAGTRPSSEIARTPEAPSTSETEVYKSLKAKLAMLVLDLPPYAVSRLKGDKYSDLAVSTSILLETDDEPGTLEDDEPNAKSKSTAIAQQPQSITPRPAAANYGVHGVTSGQYGRAPAMAPVAGRGNSTYYPNQPNQISRTPSINYNRGSTTGTTTNYNNYTPSAARPTYSQPAPAYNTTPSRPAYSQTPSYGPQQAQQAVTGNRTQYGQYYQPGVSQSAYNRQYQNPPTPSYGQRPQPQQYGYTPQPVPSPSVRTASPMQQTVVTPAAAQPARTPQVPPARPQYYGPPQASALGPSGFHTSMTPQEQQSLMDRQRAQLAMQTQSRQTPIAPSPSGTPVQSQNPPLSYSPQPPLPGTPGKPSIAGTAPLQVNGTTGN